MAKNIYMADKKAEGQTHFMPALFDVKEFVSQMEDWGVKASPVQQLQVVRGLVGFKEALVQMG